MVVAVYTGSLSALAANLFLYIINSLIAVPRINMPQLTVQLMFEQPDLTNIFVIILGIVWSMIIGGVYTFIYLIVLDFTGWNNLLLKSIAVITGLWLLGAGTIMKLFNILPEARAEPLAVAAFFIAHLFFAFVLKYLIQEFMKS